MCLGARALGGKASSYGLPVVSSLWEGDTAAAPGPLGRRRTMGGIDMLEPIRRRTLVVGLLALMLVAVACGSEGGDTDEPTTTGAGADNSCEKDQLPLFEDGQLTI